MSLLVSEMGDGRWQWQVHGTYGSEAGVAADQQAALDQATSWSKQLETPYRPQEEQPVVDEGDGIF